MSSSYFTFDHDYPSKSWSHQRSAVPVQLLSLEISSSEWDKFWDEAQATAERSKIRMDLLGVEFDKIKKEFGKNTNYMVTDKDNKEIQKLQQETKADWNKLAELAEICFAQAQVQASSKSRKIEHLEKDSNIVLYQKIVTDYFGLKFQVFNQNYEKYVGRKVLFYYDDNRQSWSVPRSPIPKELFDLGVTAKDWFEFYDYATGVKERAVLRQKENAKHSRNIRVLKNIVRGNTYESLTSEVNNKSPPTTRIQKLEQVKKDNNTNTMKGWIVLQLKVKNTWMGSKGVYVSPLLRGKVNECYGITLNTDLDYKPTKQELINEEFLQEQLLKQQQEQKEKQKREEIAKKIAAAQPKKPEVEKMPSFGSAVAGSFFLSGLSEDAPNNIYYSDNNDKEEFEASKKAQIETTKGAGASTASAAAFFLSGSDNIYHDDADVKNSKELRIKPEGEGKDELDESVRPIAEENSTWIAPPASSFLKMADVGVYGSAEDDKIEDEKPIQAPPSSAFLGNIKSQPPSSAYLERELQGADKNSFDDEDEAKENKTDGNLKEAPKPEGKLKEAPKTEGKLAGTVNEEAAAVLQQ